MSPTTALGTVGALIAILAYGLLAAGRIGPRRGYAWLSLAASALIAASLPQQFNVATAILQVFFAGISVFALTRPA